MTEQTPEDDEVFVWRTKRDEPWQPSPKELHTIRGMIIDRDKAWRRHPTWGPVINSAIRKGLKNLDEDAFYRASITSCGTAACLARMRPVGLTRAR